MTFKTKDFNLAWIRYNFWVTLAEGFGEVNFYIGPDYYRVSVSDDLVQYRDSLIPF